MPVSIGTERERASAMPAAMGVRVTMVPTLVPMLSDRKADARKKPARSASGGTVESIILTKASTQPSSLADCAKAPASTNIHSISIRFLRPAPRLNTLMRLPRRPRETAMEKIAVSMNATVMGTL